VSHRQIIVIRWSLMDSNPTWAGEGQGDRGVLGAGTSSSGRSARSPADHSLWSPWPRIGPSEIFVHRGGRARSAIADVINVNEY